MDIAIVPEGSGALAITPCPGLDGELADDLDSLREAGVVATLTLLGEEELEWLGVAGLGEDMRAAGLEWLHLPIADFGAPDNTTMALWRSGRGRVHGWLDAGRVVHLHCRMGRGRSGTMAAIILVERGWPASEAIAWVRAHRRGAVETAEQAAFIADWAAQEGRPVDALVAGIGTPQASGTV